MWNANFIPQIVYPHVMVGRAYSRRGRACDVRRSEERAARAVGERGQLNDAQGVVTASGWVGK